MGSRSILGLMYTMQGLRQLGEDPAPVLARYGLDLDRLDPAARIDRALELQIHAEVAERLRDPLAGLKAGRFFGFAGYGPLAMLLLTCADGREAIELGVRYQRLTYLYSALSFEPGEPLSAVVLAPLPLPPRAFRFRVDGEVVGTCKLMQDIGHAVGQELRPEAVEMPYARPREAQAYEAQFGCPVRFGCRQARIWLRSERLRQRFPSHDPAAHALYRGLCEQLLVQQQSAPDRFAQKVLLHLELFKDKLPAAARVARFFGMAERSFRRRLGEEGTSYRALVNLTLYARAQHLLRDTRLPVEAVAAQLGYAEPAAFIHAFQRWSGTTPLGFRGARAQPPAGG